MSSYKKVQYMDVEQLKKLYFGWIESGSINITWDHPTDEGAWLWYELSEFNLVPVNTPVLKVLYDVMDYLMMFPLTVPVTFKCLQVEAKPEFGEFGFPNHDVKTFWYVTIGFESESDAMMFQLKSGMILEKIP